MNSEVLQTHRYNLQKRVRRLASTRDESRYVMTLRQFWNFLAHNPLYQGILDDLRARDVGAAEIVDKIAEGTAGFAPETEERHASLALAMIEKCLAMESKSPVYELSHRLGRADGLEGYVEQFHELLTEPLYEFLDENLDDRRAVLGFLIRYKHRCEWFHRSRLFALWEADTQRGERLLASDMYEYLYEQGLDFVIEPQSASGEADLVSSQLGTDRLVADAKIFDPDKGKSKAYLAAAFNQIYTYTQDYNEAVGYLVVYQTGKQALKLSLPETGSSVPLIMHNNKSIFIVVIDIFPHPRTASGRGRLDVVEVSADDLATSSTRDA